MSVHHLQTTLHSCALNSFSGLTLGVRRQSPSGRRFVSGLKLGAKPVSLQVHHAFELGAFIQDLHELQVQVNPCSLLTCC